MMNLINTLIGIPLGWLMWVCYKLVSNYGLAIILFTLLSKVIMWPISVLVQKNSIKMIKLQPQLNEIAVKYAGDKDRVSEEQMALYESEKYSPALGCLPMFLQIPIILGLINVIYNPLQHLLHISQNTCAVLVEKTAQILGVAELGSGAQLRVVEAMSNPQNTQAFLSLADALPGENLEALIASVSALDTTFFGVDLAQVPSLFVLAPILLIPVLSALSTFLLCWVQNRTNVLQREQGFKSQWGVTLFTVAFSTYFTFIVPAGVGMYWVWGNIFAILQLYLLNWIYKPEKYIDYAALQKSKEALAQLNAQETARKQYVSQFKQKEKADYKRFFANGDTVKQLVFYSESSGFYKYYANLIEEILNATNVVIHYVTSDPEDAVFNLNNSRIVPYYIGDKRLIPFMMKLECDIVVMTMPDLENYHIKRSYVRKDTEYIYIPHGMDSLNLTMRTGSMDHYDTVFCVGPHQKEEIEQTQAVYGLPQKLLLEWGYGLLDDMRSAYQASAQADTASNKQKVILIAPSWQEYNIVDSCLEEILQNLQHSPYKIVVRPHPQHVKHYPEKMEALKKLYAHNCNVEVQTDFSSNSTVFEADLMITDWSGIAYEFAYTTCKPVLFINTPMKIMNPEYQKIDSIPLNILLREEIGRSLNLNQLNCICEAATDLLENTSLYHDKIASFVKKYVYNLGKSGRVGAAYIAKRLETYEKRRVEEDD